MNSYSTQCQPVAESEALAEPLGEPNDPQALRTLFFVLVVVIIRLPKIPKALSVRNRS